MQPLRDLEIGVMFWAGRDPFDTVREVKSLGVRCGQLGIPGDCALEGLAASWREAIEAEQFTVVTVFAAYSGEDYADIPTVQRTVGFIPPATRDVREKRTYEVSDFAAALGVSAIALHIGFVPENMADPDYVAVREMVRRVCDHAAKHGQIFALETGQEPAAVLRDFIRDVDRPNLRINFDPANMILYGTGDPVEALDVLAPHVASVHAKDGDWPLADPPGALGAEKPLGRGGVGIARFLAKLRSIGYCGSLHVEREGANNPEQRLRDIRAAVELLEQLRG